MDGMAVFGQVLVLFLLIVVGYLAARLHIVGESFPRQLSGFLFNITLPCTVVSAMQFSFAPSRLLQSGMLIVIGIAVTAASFGLGILAANVLRIRGGAKNVAQFAVTFSNFSFMGYPVAQAFFGEEGLFLAAVYSVPLYVFVQSLGLSLAEGPGEKRGFRLNYILNAPLVGVVVGFALFLLQWSLPKPIDETIRLLGNVTTPMAMVLVGLVLTGKPLKTAFTDWKSYVIAALRLVVLPLLVFAALRLCGLDGQMAMLPAVITMMPVAANIVLMSAAYGRDVTDAARIVLLTTLFSVVTIPAVGWLLYLL